MTAPALELADIFRVHGPAFLTTFVDSLTTQQKKALRDISLCRTAALGGHVEQCDECGHRTISCCSCCNRHCPKCGSANRAAWLEQRADELLPVEYFHVVFTLPQSLARLALQNQRVLYGILFKAASETLLQIAADPKHLGARIGFLAVLHTWGQNLHHHPHLHCVVPGPKRPLRLSMPLMRRADFCGSRVGNICAGALLAATRSFSITPAFQ